MSMMNSGRSRRGRIAASTRARVSTGSVAPVAVTTMSAPVSASSTAVQRTAWPTRSSARASAHRVGAEIARQRVGALEGAAGDGQLLHALRLQVLAGELGHLPGAEDQDVEPLEVAED